MHNVSKDLIILYDHLSLISYDIYHFNIDGIHKTKYEILTKIINKERIDIIIVLQNTKKNIIC